MTRNEKEIILRSVISAFCVSEKMFTSVEIANHVKRLGVWLRNRDVSKILHESVEEIGKMVGVNYQSELILVDKNGRNFGATVYYPYGFDADDYYARDLRAITPDEFKLMHGDLAQIEDDEEVVAQTKIKVKDGDVLFFFPK